METCSDGPAYLSIIHSILKFWSGQTGPVLRQHKLPLCAQRWLWLKTLWCLTATYPHMYLTREGFGPSDIESWLPYFCHKLAPYGCNRTIKGWERTKDLYSPFDRSPTVWKKYIFCFFTYTHKQKKHVRTHTCSDGHSQSIRHALSPQCWRCLSGRAPGCLVHRKGSLKWMYFYLLQDNVG